MKETKILSVAGLGIQESNRLKTYCSLMQENLIDHWQIEEEFIDSHVCFVDFDFITNLGGDYKPKSHITVLVTKDQQTDKSYKYQIKLPFTTNNVKQLLNDISENQRFLEIQNNKSSLQNEASENTSSLLAFGKSLFTGRLNKEVDLNKARRDENNKIITEKLTHNAAQNHQVVLLGSPRSGKSKAIHTVCDGDSLQTNLYPTDENTPIHIDYGEVLLNSKNIKIIGAPSKIKSDQEWSLLTKQADAIVVLFDLSRPEPMSYLDFYLGFITQKNTVCDIYCCFTHCDKYIGSMHQLVLQIKEKHPELKGIYHLDARKKELVINLLKHIYKF